MVSNTGEDSDGFSSSSNWNATSWNLDPNTVDGIGIDVRLVAFQLVADEKPSLSCSGTADH